MSLRVAVAQRNCSGAQCVITDGNLVPLTVYCTRDGTKKESANRPDNSLSLFKKMSQNKLTVDFLIVRLERH